MATQTQYYNLDKPSYDEVADIEIINANMDKIDTQMRNNADGVNFAEAISSDAYDNSKSYAVGDYCIYNNKLYRCITAIESAEAFNIAKWKQTTVGKEVKQLNSNLVEQKMLGWTVPSECPIQNYVDSDGVFHQKVGRVDLGSLSWNTYSFSGNNCFYALVKERKALNNNIYTSNYSTSNSSPSILADKEINGTSNENYIYIRDNTYGTDVNRFKQAVKGKYLYFELAEEKTINVDGNEAVTQIKNDLGGLSFSVSGTTLSITDGTNTWTLEAN